MHPYNRSQLLVTCSGSFEGEYVELAKSLLYPCGLYGKLLRWLRQHPNVTLLWEAIHRDDPHIIQYTEDQFGLHLIGAGDLATGFWSETALDELAAELQVPRPSWFTGSFADALEVIKTVEHEGFMIRLSASDVTFNNVALNGFRPNGFALKLKSPYYLHTKFLSRMTEKKARFMFSNGPKFKQELDEALWPLVDRVTAHCSLETWLAWSNLERRNWLQQVGECQRQPQV
ncbi:MAG: hypothetical protein HC771_21715 [Synechococcales cyanobacterium CRU_2_2]|nr:hypothetical protein [Synechococcales cyanobacterium CRU_2_2]